MNSGKEINQMTQKIRVRFLVPYFGTWPAWFPIFAVSAAYNRQFEWWLLTDLEPPEVPENVVVIRLSLNDLLDRASSQLGCSVRKNAYSICDLRPAFGVLFSTELKEIDFWGHCDLDVVWGRLELFISSEHLQRYDVVSSRRGAIAGHCTVYRNCEKVNRLFEDIPHYRERLGIPQLCRLNESAMAQVLRNRADVKVYWRAQHVVDQRELDRRPYEWRWENGHILDKQDVERAYVHFASWKKTVTNIDFSYKDAPNMIHITPRGFFCKGPRSLWDLWHIPPLDSLMRRFYNALRYRITGRGRL